MPLEPPFRLDGTKRRKSRSNFFFIFFQFPLRGVIFAGFRGLCLWDLGPSTHHPAENSLKRLPLRRKLPRLRSSEHSAVLCLNAGQRQYKGYFRGGNRSSQIWLGPRKVVDACRTASISRNSAYAHRRRYPRFRKKWLRAQEAGWDTWWDARCRAWDEALGDME